MLQLRTNPGEVLECIRIIRVYGHPLRALGGGVEGVKTDGDFAFEVATDCVQGQAESLAGILVLGPVVIMTAAFRVGSIGLKRVSTPVDEEMKVVRHHAGGRFETKHLHSLLPEVRWTAPPLHVRGVSISVLGKLQQLGNRFVHSSRVCSIYIPTDFHLAEHLGFLISLLRICEVSDLLYDLRDFQVLAFSFPL